MADVGGDGYRGNDMTRNPFTNNPFFLGFEDLERLIDRAGNDGYPPYNIEERGENAYRVTLAVAGFAMADLEITLADHRLVVRGAQENTDERVYLHRGIAGRSFERSFALAKGVDVSGALLANGLLHIDLVRAVPEDVVQSVTIEVR